MAFYLAENFISYNIRMEYHIRYTCSGDLQSQIVDFIMKNAQKYIISREVATREHIQCYVVTNVVKKTWVNKFNLKFKNMPARDKYVEEDKGKTKLYVCKGFGIDKLPEVLAKLCFTDQDVTDYHKQYWQEHIPQEIQNISVSLPEIKEEKVKKVPKPTFMKELRQVLEDEYPQKEWSMSDKPIVFKKLMFMLGQNCRNLDHIIISRMTYGVLNSLIKDKKEWLEYWFKKSFGEELNPYDGPEDYSLDE